MKFEEMADFLEDFSSELETKYAHWLFDRTTINEDELKYVRDFVKWIVADVVKDINTPRVKMGMSYAEARLVVSPDQR